MGKTLLVVESPAKAKTIEKFLGRKYQVRASMGHLRDLPKSQFGVDVENHFTPKYINIRGKGELIKDLKTAAKQADKVLLATDPDREGEAISWHLAHLLNLDVHDVCRIQFHEITKNAIQEAVKHPRRIDFDKVNAQQARRILDRIVGYKLSPLLWRKIQKGLSAGRVQSVAVRLICDREREIQSFRAEEYWSVTAELKTNGRHKNFRAEVIQYNGKKLHIVDEQGANAVVEALHKVPFTVCDVRKKERKRNPAPPFTTSSLQQEAARKLGFGAKKTMMVAQQLYEGLAISGHGMLGLITYMRTDSTRIAAEAQQEARSLIVEKYGNDYIPKQPNVYTSRNNSQDAHEAIRPTHAVIEPETIKADLSRDQYRLYKLIWERFIASQMHAAVLDTVTVDITAGPYLLRASGFHVKFKGFTVVYLESHEDGVAAAKEVILPELASGQVVDLANVLPDQHFTQPPPRFSEASLVKELEENGIGRPSTYAPIIDTIQQRRYVIKEDKKFVPTELGFLVVNLLKEFFAQIIDVDFTANMEDKFDQIADGKLDWVQLLEEFFNPFMNTLKAADEAIGAVEVPVEVSDVKCELCGRNMVYKFGRYGKFLACPGFPNCRNAKPIVETIGVCCPQCKQGEIVKRKSKRGKIFYGCSRYPDCNFVTWDQPLPEEKCPQCGAFLVMSKGKGITKIHCSRTDCNYSRVEDERQS